MPVRLHIDAPIARITFDRPEARNAMTWAMYDELASALDRIEAEGTIRVVMLRGAGGHFVAGTDIGQFAGFTSGDDGVEYERRLEGAIARLEALPLPTIAVIEGNAAGGGLAIACACDLRLCTPDARFSAPIARTVGNTLSLANHARLVVHLGAARAKSLLLTAGSLDAAEARLSGFVLDVVARDELESRADELASQVSRLAPLSLRASKVMIGHVMAALRGSEDEALLRSVYGSRDFAEGVRAFAEKRKPTWEGR